MLRGKGSNYELIAESAAEMVRFDSVRLLQLFFGAWVSDYI